MESLVVYEDIGENSISFVSATCKNNIQKSWIRDGGIRTKTEGMMTNIYSWLVDNVLNGYTNFDHSYY